MLHGDIPCEAPGRPAAPTVLGLSVVDNRSGVARQAYGCYFDPVSA
jgi:hypothetical protein